MGNPYYVAPRSNALGAADVVTRLLDIARRGREATARNKLTEQEIDQRDRISTMEDTRAGERIQLGREQLGLDRRRMDIEQQQANTAATEAPAHKQNFDLGRVKMLRSALRVGGVEKAFEPILKDMETLAENPQVNRADAYRVFSDPNYIAGAQKRILEGLSKDYAKALQDGDTMKAKDLSKFMQGVGDAKGFTARINALFRGTRESLATEELTRAKLASEAMGEGWSQPYKDEYGNIVQKNLQTGQIEKISGVPSKTSLVVGPDGTVQFQQGAGGTETTVGAKTQMQKDVLAIADQLNALKPALENYSSDLLTYQGKLKRWALNKASRAGIDIGKENEAFVARARLVQEGLETVFNIYRKQITGAQAVMKELTMLRYSILNKNLSPAEFDASVKRFIKLGQDAINLRMDLMNKGFSESIINQRVNDLVSATQKDPAIMSNEELLKSLGE